MATNTTFLKLILPLNGEYHDTWDEACNSNFEALDEWASSVDEELVNARFGQLTLAAFLSIGIASDGPLKPTTEIINSRSSLLYGDEVDDTHNYDLPKRLNLGDTEVFRAREGLPSLRSSIEIGRASCRE